ncbi:MAG: hypothetical protein EXR72_00905 [Myxococcales bacterium]|nr:hypothetical protein [Myxococcales bacterium]
MQALIEAAHAEGMLSRAALNALTIEDLGARIQAGLGMHVDDVPASEVLLLTIMPDDSGSIAVAGNEGAVRDGHNLVIEALASSKSGGAILAHTRYLNGTVLFPYRPIAGAPRMDGANYRAALGTPLFDQSVVLLGTVIAKTREFAESGVPARSITLLITDGGDQHSVRAQAGDVAALVSDLAATEEHIVAAMGIDDGNTDFRRVFREMGIDDRWILTPGNSAQEIRRAFQVFSQSALRASQGAAGFGQAALGGFGR